jgi:hypothetical protein
MADDFQERMELGRVQAVQARNRGHHTGKSAKGWNAKRSEHIAGTWDHAVTVATVRWQNGAAMALLEYQQEVFPERWNPDESLDDLIARRNDAERDALLETF